MLASYGLNLWWIVGALFLGGLLVWKYTYEFSWFHFWYGVPFVGTLGRLNDITPDSVDNTWTRAERKLCADYGAYIHLGDFAEFNNRAEYLRKAGDLGTKPISKWGEILLWALIVAEGFGFAYALGSWIALEASENLRTLLMIVVSLIVAVPSIVLSHEAGVRYHRSRTEKRYKDEWKAEGQPGKFRTNTISLAHNQSVDDAELACTQYANRAHPKKGLGPIWGALLWALAVVVLSTSIRYLHLKTVIEEEVSGVKDGIPEVFRKQEDQRATVPEGNASQKVVSDAKQVELVEGMAAFLMLALMYLATQGVGAVLAAKSAFVGAQSDAAYDANLGFETYDRFMVMYEPIAKIAQARLQTLQQRLGEQYSNTALKLHKSFEDYLLEERNKRDERKQKNVPEEPQIGSDSASISSPIALGRSSFCTKCGAAIGATVSFCGECGAKVG